MIGPVLFIMKEKDINKYMLGDNPNLIGTILAFRKVLVKSKYLEYVENAMSSEKTKYYSPESYAVLLYFDHRIGRITRYLFNYNLIYWNRKPNILNIYRGINILGNREVGAYVDNVSENAYDQDPELYNIEGMDRPAFTFNVKDVDNVRYVPTIVIDNNKFPIDEQNILLNYKLMFDGKINRRMIYLFIYELVRNYLLSGCKIKENCDMELIHMNATPDVTKFPVIDYPSGKGVIYYPKSIHINKQVLDGISAEGFTLEHREINHYPQVIKDLRKFINPSTIQNKKFLDNRIERFNDSIERYVNSNNKN